MTPSSHPGRSLLLALATLAAGALVATAAQAVAPAPDVELARYLGRWYVIARYPSDTPPPRGAFFEFAARADGKIDDRYHARAGSFEREFEVVARRADPDAELPSRWQVGSGWFGGEERWILYVSPDYRYALAGAPGREAGWILARDPVISEWRYAGLLARFALQGYDVSRLRRVPQKPEQVNRPGFE